MDGKNIIKIKYNDECNNSHKNVLLTNIKQIEPFIYHIKIINKWEMEVTFVVECILLEVTSIEIYHLFGWLQFHSVSLMDFHFFQFSLLRRTYNIPFPMNDNYLALLQCHLVIYLDFNFFHKCDLVYNFVVKKYPLQ